jgi:hypothetical protein
MFDLEESYSRGNAFLNNIYNRIINFNDDETEFELWTDYKHAIEILEAIEKNITKDQYENNKDIFNFALRIGQCGLLLNKKMFIKKNKIAK